MVAIGLIAGAAQIDQSSSPGSANVYTHLVHDSLEPQEFVSPKQHFDRFIRCSSLCPTHRQTNRQRHQSAANLIPFLKYKHRASYLSKVANCSLSNVYMYLVPPSGSILQHTRRGFNKVFLWHRKLCSP